MTTIAPTTVTTPVQNPNFKGHTRLVDVQKYPDYEVRTYETDATAGKKWGVGIGSWFLPGLGQAINGQWGKAVAFFGGAIASGIAMGSGVAKNTVDAMETLIKNPSATKFPKGGTAMMAIGALGAVACTIGSIVDAVKNAKTTTTQIVQTGKDKTIANA